MNLIQPNCRVQFTAPDVDFILQTLGARLGTQACLVRLLADEESRDLILDDETLFHAVLENRGCLAISARFYFYVLVRHVFRRADLDDRSLADYVAELLAAFSESAKSNCALPGQQNTLDYFFEMVAALQNADDRSSFELRLHIGNRSLFCAGVFPERIRNRAESRGFPDLKYYEQLGKTHFRMAAMHRLAERYHLQNILLTLAERFHATRRALNDLADRLFSIGDSGYALDALLNPRNNLFLPPGQA